MVVGRANRRSKGSGRKNPTGYPSIDKPWLKYYDKEFLARPIPAMNIYTCSIEF
jgi:hypothetical protein